MKGWLSVLSTVAAMGLGFAIGRVTAPVSAPAGSVAAVEKLERERDEAIVRAAALEAKAQALEARRSEPGEPGPAKQPASGTKKKPAPPAALSPDAAARAQKLAEITEHLEEDFASGNGDEALSALRHLADVLPEGRGPAMALALRIDEDVRGEGTLGVDMQDFYKTLGDDGLRDLMIWSLENESPVAFRRMSANNLRWIVTRDRAIEVLVPASAREKDLDVQLVIAGSLGEIRDPRAVRALIALFNDRGRDLTLRAQVAQLLARSMDDAALEALRSAARDDPDERVRAAAQAALVARDPPADGVYVSSVLPNGGASGAGMRAGDIVVTYDGKAVRTKEELLEQIQAATGRESVPVVVHRGGAETTLSARGGPLGIEARTVRRK